MKFSAVVLAAGLGKRMKSKVPKVLHKVMGVPLILHALRAVKCADEIIVVVGHKAEMVEEVLPQGVKVAHQDKQLGTGHAVMVALNQHRDIGEAVVVVPGDMPFIKEGTVKAMMELFEEKKPGAVLLSADITPPPPYGRIIREGGMLKIIEETDATLEQRKITKVNLGVYVFERETLKEALGKITPDNAQGEYYLTDTIQVIQEIGKNVLVYETDDPIEAMGINNRKDLAKANEIMRMRKLEELMLSGVEIVDPRTTYIGMDVEVGKDTIIHPCTVIDGKTTIGEDCEIGPFAVVLGSKVSKGVRITMSHVEGAEIGEGVKVGPFARVRPGTKLGEGVSIGNFVEVKKSVLGDGVKVNHLSYIGDAEVGEGTNIGAGTITCNYDGYRKHKTKIGKRVFIGSDTILVAPIKVGDDAFTAAGSVITEDVPPEALAIARARQVNKEGWVPKYRDRKRRELEGEPSGGRDRT